MNILFITRVRILMLIKQSSINLRAYIEYDACNTTFLRQGLLYNTSN